MITAALFTILCILPWFHFDTDYIHLGWFLGLSGVATVICLRLYRDGHRLFSVTTLYFALNALYIACYRSNRYFENPVETRTLFSHNALYFLLSGILLLDFLKEKDVFTRFENILGISCMANVLSVFIGYIRGTGQLDFHGGYSGFIDYESVNGVTIAVMIPFLWNRKLPHRVSMVMTLTALLAVYLTGSSAPVLAVAVLAAVFLSYLPLWKVYRLSPVWVISIVLIASLAIYFSFGELIEGSGALDDTGRFAAWRIFMGEWAKRLPMIWGSGPGTYTLFAVETQLKTGYNITGTTGSFWIFLHNEWLQTLYESGVIGFTLFTATFLNVCYRYWKRCDFRHLSALLSYGAASLVVFPTRYFYGAVIGAYLLFRGEFDETV